MSKIDLVFDTNASEDILMTGVKIFTFLGNCYKTYDEKLTFRSSPFMQTSTLMSLWNPGLSFVYPNFGSV